MLRGQTTRGPRQRGMGIKSRRDRAARRANDTLDVESTWKETAEGSRAVASWAAQRRVAGVRVPRPCAKQGLSPGCTPPRAERLNVLHVRQHVFHKQWNAMLRNMSLLVFCFCLYNGETTSCQSSIRRPSPCRRESASRRLLPHARDPTGAVRSRPCSHCSRTPPQDTCTPCTMSCRRCSATT